MPSVTGVLKGLAVMCLAGLGSGMIYSELKSVDGAANFGWGVFVTVGAFLTWRAWFANDGR